ncbi:unnamed protein product [Lathyrus oleraceus]
MAEVVKFLYVIIIFLSLILVAVNLEDIDCSNKSNKFNKFDCPRDMCLYQSHKTVKEASSLVQEDKDNGGKNDFNTMEKMCAAIDEHWCQTQKLEDNILHIQQRQHKATPTDQGEMLTEKYELLCIKIGNDNLS